MASITRVGSGWRAQLYIQGIRESSMFSSKTEAQKWAKSREIQLREKLPPKHEAKPISKDRRKFMQLSELHSEEKIVATAFDARPTSGVYFLIRDGKIVYVGKSMNVHSRIATHQRSKEFDRINFVECPEESLHRLEQMYIRKFNPELNIAGRNDHLPALEDIEWQA